MNELESTVHRLVERINKIIEDYNGEPGSWTFGRSWKVKPSFEHHELLQEVQRHLPNCGFEIIRDITMYKSIYVLEWKVYF